MKINRHWIGVFIFFLALGFRLWRIQADLPLVYNYDEPHILNIAAHFGTGDLNPHDFKYPTLWPYLVAGLFGMLFVVGKILGLVHSANHFGVLFLNEPTVFYVTVRVATAVFSSLSAWVLYKIGEKEGDFVLASLLGLMAALCPSLLEYGRDATQYSFMVFLVACSMYFLHDLLRSDGSSAPFIWGGVFVGLAVSTHYIAAPMGVLLVSLYFLQNKEVRQPRYLFWGIAAGALAFVMGSPFIVGEFGHFVKDLAGIHELQNSSLYKESLIPLARLIRLAFNFVQFIDPWGLGFVFVVCGFIFEKPRKRLEFAAWLTPIFISFPVLMLSHYGMLPRYAFAISLPLFIPAAAGMRKIFELIGPARWKKTLFCLVIFAPFTLKCLGMNRELNLPDTRTAAKKWIETHIPPGEIFLLIDPFRTAPLKMNLVQLERLYERCQQLNHPRKDYYRLLLEGFTGGGYEIYALKRSAFAVQDIPGRTSYSYQAQDTFDMESEKVEGLFKKRIHYVVLDDYSESQPSLQIRQKLQGISTLVAAFSSEPHNKMKGPALEIYRIDSPRKS